MIKIKPRHKIKRRHKQIVFSKRRREPDPEMLRFIELALWSSVAEARGATYIDSEICQPQNDTPQLGARDEF